VKNKIVVFIYTVLTWAILSVSLWLTVSMLNLTSTNQFTGKMKSFELELVNSFRGMAVITISILIILSFIKKIKKNEKN
jgi:hypothetical protein